MNIFLTLKSNVIGIPFEALRRVCSYLCLYFTKIFQNSPVDDGDVEGYMRLFGIISADVEFEFGLNGFVDGVWGLCEGVYERFLLFYYLAYLF